MKGTTIAVFAAISVWILYQNCTIGRITRQNDGTTSKDQSAYADLPPSLEVVSPNWTILMSGSGVHNLIKETVNEGFNVVVRCTALYPVDFVYDVNERNLNTEPTDSGFRPKLFYTIFNDSQTYKFYTRDVFRFTAVSKETSFFCRSIPNPCLQHEVEFTFLDDNPNHMTITLHQSGDQCSKPLSTTVKGSNPTQLSVHDPLDDDDCEANFFYQKGYDDGIETWAFRCQFADESPGVIKRFDCFNSIKCGNLLRKGSQKNCWHLRPYSHSNCTECQVEKPANFNPFVAICTKIDDDGTYLESQIGVLGFYGVVTDESLRPPFFVEPNKIDEAAMIYLEPVEVVEDMLNLGCRISGYYNSATFQFALEVEDTSELIILELGLENKTIWKSWLGAWHQEMSTKLNTSLKITRVYCFGHVLNTLRWINASRPFKIIEADTTPARNDGDGDDTDAGNGSRLTIILISVALVGIAIVSLYLVVERWRSKSTKVVRDLRRHEMKQFLNGNSHYQVGKCPHCSSDVEMPIYCLPYNSKFETPRQNIQLDPSEELGKGEFGKVFKGTVVTEDGRRVVAIKTTKGNVQVKEFLAFLSEIKIMAQLESHPNIVGLVAASTSSMKKRIALAALEYCANGNLKMFLKRTRHKFQHLLATPKNKTDASNAETNGGNPYASIEEFTASASDINFTTLTLIDFASGIANGLCYLSEKMVIHGDIAARNILLDENFQVKISDFGLSSFLVTNSNYVKKQGDKIPWKHMPIEALRDGKFSIQSDVWSYGVTLWEIFSLGKKPYRRREGIGRHFVKFMVEFLKFPNPSYCNNPTMIPQWWPAQRR